MIVKMPKGTKIEGANLLDGSALQVKEVARDEYHVNMSVQDPGKPFVIRLKVKKAGEKNDRYRDALT